MHHLVKHGFHVVLVVSALIVLRLAEIDLSMGALVGLMAACLVAFEGGLWLIHRRDAAREHASAGS